MTIRPMFASAVVLVLVGALHAQQSTRPADVSLMPHTGTTPAASPMSYAVGGRQYIALAAGNTLYAFAVP